MWTNREDHSIEILHAALEKNAVLAVDRENLFNAHADAYFTTLQREPGGGWFRKQRAKINTRQQ